MKNNANLKFVRAMEYFAELLSIVLIFDTKYAINNGGHFVNKCFMQFITITIFVTFIFKIICRLIFKERKLVNGEIDTISKGMGIMLLVWIGIIVVLLVCINVEAIGGLQILGVRLKDIIS